MFCRFCTCTSILTCVSSFVIHRISSADAFPFSLSGGQKQRLAIARAIVNSPEIIFADEPTGNLDSATSEKIEKLLFEYNKKSGATLFIITHDEELAEKCDIRIRIKDGEIEHIEGVKNA